MYSIPKGPHPIVHIKGGSLDDFTPVFDSFMKERGLRFVIGFSGSADDSSPLLATVATALREQGIDPNPIIDHTKEEHIATIVREMLQPLRGYRIAVLTGGTKWGVPMVATKVAKQLGFSTIGVSPLTAYEKGHVLSEELVDLPICVYPFMQESVWGDEAAIYTKLLNAVIIIGGGAGTMIEVAHLLKRNEKKKGADVKPIIPIYGTGGTAEKLLFLPGKAETMAHSLPPELITSGAKACEYLKRHLVFLDDIYD